MLGIVMWVVTGIAIAGVILNIYKKWQGFALWIIADVALIAHNASLGEWSQVVLWSVYLVLAVYGLIKWTTENAR